MKLSETVLSGAFEISSDHYADERGEFARLFCVNEVRKAFGDLSVVQINKTLTRRTGALRGLHFQHPPHAEAKLVRCLKGHVFDVAVDLRRGSPTMLHWHAVELSADRMNAFFIPEGCAHGFQTLTDNSELLYLHTAAYEPNQEGGVGWSDPALGINWPLTVTDISQRDKDIALLDPDFEGLQL